MEGIHYRNEYIYPFLLTKQNFANMLFEVIQRKQIPDSWCGEMDEDAGGVSFHLDRKIVCIIGKRLPFE